MNTRFRIIIALLPGFVLAGSASAQKALYAEHGGTYRLVRHVLQNFAYVDDDTGRSVAASGSHYVLRDAPEFEPCLISIRDLGVKTRSLELMDTGSEINRRFDFTAEFESAFRLKNVFVVLDLKCEDAGNLLFVQEVGDMEPRERKPLHIQFRLTQAIGAGEYEMHLFSDGTEVFHSNMPFDFIEHHLDQMVQKQIKGATSANPQPFVGPPPEYPAKLRRAKVSGNAVLRFTIGPTGKVLDPEVVSATDPAFGETSVAAARQWRFLPRIKDGVPVTTTVKMPFVFKP